jgi:hypothetical protein
LRSSTRCKEGRLLLRQRTCCSCLCECTKGIATAGEPRHQCWCVALCAHPPQGFMKKYKNGS